MSRPPYIPRWSNGEHHAPPIDLREWRRSERASFPYGLYFTVAAFMFAYALLAIVVCFPRIITGL